MRLKLDSICSVQLPLHMHQFTDSTFCAHRVSVSYAYVNTSHFAHYRKLSEEDASSGQIKVLIDQHLKQKEEVESSIPQAIVIGPFHINTEVVRLALSKKHKDIAQALLNFLAKTLHKQAEHVSSYEP